MYLYIRRLLCIAFFLPQLLFSQSNRFVAFTDDPMYLQGINSQFQKAFQKEVSSLPKENRKELVKFYQLRHENVTATIGKNEIYTSPVATAYLDKLVEEIISKNPMLQDRRPACFFSRSGVPNAASLGEGLIVLNMGLFNKLNNESQAAFILCHELAHHFLRHSEKSISAYVSTLYSDETQDALKSIKRSQYNKGASLEALMKDMSFDSHRHSRDHESEADSMAVEFLRSTRFSLRESLTTLALLDSVDSPDFNTSEYLAKTFTSTDYPFKQKWLKKETGLMGARQEPDRSIVDSLKTHPDCQTRIQILQPLVGKYDSPDRKTFLIDVEKFKQLKSVFNYEIVEYNYRSKNYTRSLFAICATR